MSAAQPPHGPLIDIAYRAMREHGLEPDLPPAAAVQLASIRTAAAASGPTIRDLRALPWCSIDNDSSRDLDQLSVAEPLAGDAVKILVAVADVDATVAAGTPLDAHAATNTTSVYTAALTFPMFPDRLSTDLTSLAEDCDRLSLIVEMTIDAEGRITAEDVYRAQVRNHAKLAYDSVAAWLDGRGPAPGRVATLPQLAGQLRIQDRVAQALKRVRHEAGALGLSTPEAQAVFAGVVLVDLRPQEDNRARELIEYFMIAANGVVARRLEALGSPSLRRALPEPERWDRIVELARRCGAGLPAKPDAQALSAFLAARQRAEPARFGDLSLAVVKLLGAAEYVLKRPGQPVETHFALAVEDYTHATAPNRRYPDVITQRLVKAALAGAPVPYAEDALRTLAAHCSAQERNAARVERQVRKSAAAQLLAPRIGETFDAVVTGATPQGTWVRVEHPLVEGRVVHGFAGLDVGDATRVRLVHTDVARGYIDFARAG